MNVSLGIGLIVGGCLLIATRHWSADLHERWNPRFAWTRWVTGPTAMRTSQIANVLVGLGLIALGLWQLSPA
jgi:hypothetical protein